MATGTKVGAASPARSKSLDELHDLIQGISIAMFTTRRADGHLVSRPMATQVRAPGADLWFVTMKGQDKLDEIAADPHVNLAYCRPNGREWVSVAGRAFTSTDPATLHLLWRPDWSVWFPKGAGARSGTPDDPRIVLIGVEAHSATFLTADKPAPLAFLELVKGYVTGRRPKVGKVRQLEAGDLHSRKGEARAPRARGRTKATRAK
jgi:general stress protein 26